MKNLDNESPIPAESNEQDTPQELPFDVWAKVRDNLGIADRIPDGANHPAGPCHRLSEIGRHWRRRQGCVVDLQSVAGRQRRPMVVQRIVDAQVELAEAGAIEQRGR